MSYPSLRAKLRVKAPLPNLALLRDELSLTLDGTATTLSLTRSSNAEIVLESEIVTLERKALSMKMLSRGLVLEYLFWEGSGTTLHDSSGNDNHGAIYGATWRQLPNGKYYLDFDGVDDYVEVPYSGVFNVDKLLVEVVAYIDKQINSRQQWMTPVMRDHCFALAFDHPDAGTYFAVYLVEVGWRSCRAPSAWSKPGGWHHAVAVYDGTKARLYIDAELVTECVYEGTLNKPTDNVWFMANLNTKEYARGGVALARIFDYSLVEQRLSETGKTLDDFVSELYEIAKIMVPELGG